jgi:hypothetical protein
MTKEVDVSRETSRAGEGKDGRREATETRGGNGLWIAVG